MASSIQAADALGHPAIGIGPVTHLLRTIAATTDNDAPALHNLIRARSNIQPGESGGACGLAPAEVVPPGGLLAEYGQQDCGFAAGRRDYRAERASRRRDNA